jgi:hypothetical protein
VTSIVPPALRATVIARAEDRCEYCGLWQVGQEATFHIDHIVPRAAGGPTVESNLALACVGCSLHKATRQTGLDPETGESVALFNPRTERWADHFTAQGVWIHGSTPQGRATVETLKMNRQLLLEARAAQELLTKQTLSQPPQA